MATATCLDASSARDATYSLLVNKDGSASQEERRDLICKAIVEATVFKVLSYLCLFIALFGSFTVHYLDFPDEPSNDIVDVVMTVITLFFILEIVLRSIGEYSEYFLSFFFWMDIIGTLSMAFEVSYLLGSAGRIQEPKKQFNAVAMRGARAARIGARAGRLSRPLRLLNSILRREKFDAEEAGYSAKVLGQRLTQVFGAKVAMLTVILVLGVPLFNIGRYPEEDFSLAAWADKLEMDYARDFQAMAESDGRTAHKFQDSVSDMVYFYTTVPHYFPYQLRGYSAEVEVGGETVNIPGTDVVNLPEPARKQNVIKQVVDRCALIRPGCDDMDKASIYYDFTGAKRYDAGMDILVTIFIIMCMVIESCDLSFNVDRMMVKPMERMLDSARLMTKQIKQAMSKGKAGKSRMTKALGKDVLVMGDDDGASGDPMNELEALQGLFTKVVFLINVFMEQDVAEEMETMDESSQGVMIEVAQNAEAAKRASTPQLRSSQVALQRSTTIGTPQADVTERVLSRPEAAATSEVKDPLLLESWGFTMLERPAAERDAFVDRIVFESEVGKLTGAAWLDRDVFTKFRAAVTAGYLYNSYHMFTHACEVLACLYRLMLQLQWRAWLGELDATALMISALVGDIGHPGFTNSFLVETGHELAIKYNDRSPLENMHCAKLFEICRETSTNVFGSLEKAAYKQVRSVCVEALLHTDNAVHFDLMKEVKKVYGLQAEMCDAQAASPDTLARQYVSEVLAEQKPLWNKLMLHLADISNQSLTFHVAQLWSKRVMDEFFFQGDEEKKLRIPVGALNDRKKVSIPGSQFGFVSMLVVPMASSVIRIFPMLYPIAETTVINLERWQSLWSKEPGYNTEHAPQHLEKIRKAKDQIYSYRPADKQSDKRNKASKRGSQTLDDSCTPDLTGAWTCVATFGLEEFLKFTGTGLMRRKAALAAPWPGWEFQQSGDNIVFINNSAVGVLREEITADRKPFTIVDGWKQTVTCVAYWEQGALVIEKEGPQGKFKETRCIDSEGKLQFTLEPVKPAGPKWGRSFAAKTENSK